MHRFRCRPLSPACLAMSLVLGACGGSGSGSVSPSPTPSPGLTTIPTPTPTVSPSPTPGATSVSISGKVSYEWVPHTARGSLDYSASIMEPVKGATVQLLSADDAVIDATVLNDSGEYELNGLQNTLYKVRVLSELNQQGSASWDFKVTDNTQSNALYALDGELVNSGTVDSERDLEALSGWGGSSYTSTRAAAPFAILDSVYQALKVLLEIDSGIQLSPTEFRWSVNNQPIGGSEALGEIGTSSYSSVDEVIYILGAENVDTDEYDRSVIQHEFTHYLEGTQSRSNSIGGAHSLNSITDMRVAYSEGLANAFTAIVSGTGNYSDSSGSSQDSGFLFSIDESSTGDSLGWYSENSVGKLMFDIVDARDDGVNTLADGFEPIWRTLTSDNYINNTAFISIYVFAEEVENYLPANELDRFTALLTANNIQGEGNYGEGETNNGGFVANLPIYSSLDIGSTVDVCTDNEFGEYNYADNRRFIRFQVSSRRSYEIRVENNLSESSGSNDPDAALYRDGVFVASLTSFVANSEVSNRTLDTGDYLLEVYAYENTDGVFSGDGQACFQVSVQ